MIPVVDKQSGHAGLRGGMAVDLFADEGEYDGILITVPIKIAFLDGPLAGRKLIGTGFTVGG